MPDFALSAGLKPRPPGSRWTARGGSILGIRKSEAEAGAAGGWPARRVVRVTSASGSTRRAAKQAICSERGKTMGEMRLIEVEASFNPSHRGSAPFFLSELLGHLGFEVGRKLRTLRYTIISSKPLKFGVNPVKTSVKCAVLNLQNIK